jgi:hypothetical protein
MNTPIEAFPLSWPHGYPRTISYRRERARFKDKTFGSARDSLMAELRRMGATSVILSTSIPLKSDGMPYANRNRLPDPGVAVYFTWKKKQHVIACDNWDKIESNTHAIQLTVEAMRGLDRWACTEMLERAFQGFSALPPPPADEKWWDVLEVIEMQYKTRARQAHPDLGGNLAKMQKLNAAIEQAREARR